MSDRQVYLKGWKEIAEFLGIHWESLRRWHYEVLRLPVQKLGSRKQSRITIQKITLIEWYRCLGKSRKYKTRLYDKNKQF
jgi:hypothetical protein